MRRRCLRSGWYGSVILCRPFPNVIGAAAEIAPIIAMLSKVLLTSLACLGLKGLAVRVVARTRRMIAARATVACRLCGSSSI